jgi:predicted metalloprotease
VVAHEYGHHVQQVSGILPAFYDIQYNITSRAARLEFNRRMELQASCFAAVFVGANRRALPITGNVRRQWDWMTSHSGDVPGYPRDHGSFRNHDYWSRRGFNSQNVGLCNNFTAAARYAS